MFFHHLFKPTDGILLQGQILLGYITAVLDSLCFNLKMQK